MVELFGLSLQNYFDISHFLTVVITGVVVWMITNWLSNRRKEEQDITNWYNEAQSLIARAMYLGTRRTLRSKIDYTSIDKELNSIGEDLFTHSKKAPDGVDRESINDTELLSKIYQKVSVYAEIGSQKGTEEGVAEFFQIIEEREG